VKAHLKVVRSPISSSGGLRVPRSDRESRGRSVQARNEPVRARGRMAGLGIGAMVAGRLPDPSLDFTSTIPSPRVT
jgi:hypothetical protein